MCNAFSKNGFNTILLVPKSGVSDKYLFEYYDVKNPFNIIEVNIPKIFANKYVPGLAFLFSLLATKKLIKMKDFVIYTRCPWIIFIISFFYKQLCFFESHTFRFQSFLQTFIYRFIVKYSSKSGKGFITLR